MRRPKHAPAQAGRRAAGAIELSDDDLGDDAAPPPDAPVSVVREVGTRPEIREVGTIPEVEPPFILALTETPAPPLAESVACIVAQIFDFELDCHGDEAAPERHMALFHCFTRTIHDAQDALVGAKVRRATADRLAGEVITPVSRLLVNKREREALRTTGALRDLRAQAIDAANRIDDARATADAMREVSSNETLNSPLPAGGWTRPQPVAMWVRVFGCSRNTIGRRFKKQQIRNEKVGRWFRVAIDALPEWERRKHLPPTNP